jgi:uncharacterized integral membrane protein
MSAGVMSTTITIHAAPRKTSAASLKTLSPREKPITPPSPNQTFVSSSHSYNVPVHVIEDDEDEHSDDVLLFGYYSLKHYSRPVQFLMCGGGVCLFYVLQSIAKEYLFLTYKSEINFSCFLALVQCFGYTLLAAAQMYMFNNSDKSKRGSWRLPHKIGGGTFRFLLLMVIIGLLGDVSMAFSNISLQYLPFPTFVMVKSCKVLAAMLLSVLLHQLQRLYFRVTHKSPLLHAKAFENPKYNRLDYTAAFILVVGLIVLALANQKDAVQISSIFFTMDWRGIVLALLAVMADALVSLVQELAMRNNPREKGHKQNKKEEPVTVIFYSYGFGFIVLFIYSAFLSDEFWVVTAYALVNPKFVLLLLVSAV